ncbi:hypothetical protein ACIPLR_21810, partial [Herbaspirillum huttiense]
FAWIPDAATVCRDFFNRRLQVVLVLNWGAGQLNQTLFLWLNAPEHPSALALTLAVFFAERLIWAMPLVIGIGWPTTPAQASGDDSSSGN